MSYADSHSSVNHMYRRRFRGDRYGEENSARFWVIPPHPYGCADARLRRARGSLRAQIAPHTCTHTFTPTPRTSRLMLMTRATTLGVLPQPLTPTLCRKRPCSVPTSAVLRAGNAQNPRIRVGESGHQPGPRLCSTCVSQPFVQSYPPALWAVLQPQLHAHSRQVFRCAGTSDALSFLAFPPNIRSPLSTVVLPLPDISAISPPCPPRLPLGTEHSTLYVRLQHTPTSQTSITVCSRAWIST